MGVVLVAIFFVVRSDIDTKFFPPSALLPNGGQYYGKLKDNLLTGVGKIIWSNGASYHGNFKHGLYHGNGKLISTIGDIYEGQFVDGEFTGQGQVKTFDGSIYQGQFKNFYFNGHGRWEFGENSHYVGQFKHGRYHGYGALVIPDGDSYNGNFDMGVYEGEGEIHYASGNTYKGHFKQGKLHGKGIFTSSEGDVYEGNFDDANFTGQGINLDADGNRYEGGFIDWRYAGKGHYRNTAGDVYEGEFVAGSFTGKGVFKGKDGSSYQGKFKRSVYNGKGVLLAANGDRYEGHFKYGKYSGKGILTYATPKNGKSALSGEWRYGRYIGDGTQADPRELNVEKALYVQQRLLNETIDKVQESDPNRINLYFIGIGGDGKQNVFYNEIAYIQTLFDESFDTKGRSAILVNNADTVNSIALATVTSIERTLIDVAAKMDAKKDILFLYMTSHGSKEHELAIDQHGLSLPDLGAEKLGEMLANLSIRWKVVVISACYSGGFIPFLKDDYTMIITAAAHDRTSFGCSDEAEMTYFGRAFFKESIPTSQSFETAFMKAKSLVDEWEEKEIAGIQNQHSKPQISRPKRIINYLKKWREQLKQQESEANKIPAS